METKIGTYIDLFHGRATPEENLNDWGTPGPTLGPFDDISITYATHIKCSYNRGADIIWLKYDGDLVEFNGVYYGDIAMFAGRQISETEVQSLSDDRKYVVTPYNEVDKKYFSP